MVEVLGLRCSGEAKEEERAVVEDQHPPRPGRKYRARLVLRVILLRTILRPVSWHPGSGVHGVVRSVRGGIRRRENGLGFQLDVEGVEVEDVVAAAPVSHIAGLTSGGSSKVEER